MILSEKKRPKQPMQPVICTNGGVVRFQSNAIVDYLLDQATRSGVCDMNKIAALNFSDEDRMQFAQLIGYSVGGYGTLSYVSDKSYNKACSKKPINITSGL